MDDPSRDWYEFVSWDNPVPSVFPATSWEFNAIWNPIDYTIVINLNWWTWSYPDSYTIESDSNFLIHLLDTPKT